MLSIFSAIDNGDGILDKNEAAKLKKMLIESARDDNLSEAEAMEFLQKSNIKNAAAKDLFKFLNLLTESGNNKSSVKTSDSNNSDIEKNKAKQNFFT